MAIIDLFSNCVVCMLVGVMIGMYGYRTICGVFSGLIFVIILANLLLLCGLSGSCGALIAAWQIIMFLYILLLIVGWILIPFIFVIDYQPFIVNGPDQINMDIQIDLPPLNYLQSGAIMLGLLILPIYYSYFWIVANSYRRSLSRRRKRSRNLGPQTSENVFFVRNEPVYLPANYQQSFETGQQVTPVNYYDEQSAWYTQGSIAQPPPQWALYDAQTASYVHEQYAQNNTNDSAPQA